MEGKESYMIIMISFYCNYLEAVRLFLFLSRNTVLDTVNKVINLAIVVT